MAKSWRGKSFLAILIALVIFWSVIAVSIGYMGEKLLSNLSVQLVPQMPTLIFNQGTVKTEQAKPAYLYLKNDHIPFVVIDTHGQLSETETLHATIMVHHDRILIKTDHGGINKFDIPTKYNGTVTAAKMGELAQHFIHFIVPLIVALCVLLALGLSYFVILTLNFTLGIFGWLLAALMNREVGFWGVYSIALMAWVPVLMINMILFLLSVKSFWLFSLLLILYILYGVISMRSGREIE